MKRPSDIKLPETFVSKYQRVAPHYLEGIRKLILEAGTGKAEERLRKIEEDCGAEARIQVLRSAKVVFSEDFTYLMPRFLQQEFETAEIPKGLSWEDLQPPSDCFYLALPDNPCLIDNTPLRGVAVHLFNTPEGEERMCLLAWCPRPAGDECLDVFTDMYLDSEALTDVECYLTSPGVVEFLAGKHERRSGAVVPDDVEQELQKASIYSARYVLNFLLHWNMSADSFMSQTEVDNSSVRKELQDKIANARSTGKAKKYQRRLDRVQAKRWVVLDAPCISSASTEGVRRSTDRRVGSHWRAGHYHRYWTGSKKDENGNPRRGERMVLKYVPQTWVSGTTGKRAQTKALPVLTTQKHLQTTESGREPEPEAELSGEVAG